MLTLLDKLAGMYLDWRAKQAVQKYREEMGEEAPDPQEVELKRVELQEDGLKLLWHAPALVALAGEAAALLNAYDAENYVSFDMMPRPDHALRPIRVVVGWANGMSPATKAFLAEERAKVATEHREETRFALQALWDEVADIEDYDFEIPPKLKSRVEAALKGERYQEGGRDG
jgi:hypothetical protein